MQATYPSIQPYHTEYIACDEQRIYVQHIGNPDGLAVVYLHGGPGAGISEISTRYFNPERYHIIVFDQRGCGRSTPANELVSNHTQALVNDIETIRMHCNIERWVVAGGSWGTTLALVYGIAHPHRVLGMILRGIFLARKEDSDWFLSPSGGAAQVFPDHFERFLTPINHPNVTVKTAADVLSLYASVFDTGCEITTLAAAKAWCRWEMQLSTLKAPSLSEEETEGMKNMFSMARLECHYLRNYCFLDEGYILNNLDKLANIPSSIIHGRFDMVCKLSSAYQLVSRWSSAKLIIIPDAGHSGSEPSIATAMTQSADAMEQFLTEEHK